MKSFWSFTLYDNQTRAELQTDQRFPTLGSQTKGIETNADGSYDIYFAPAAPKGKIEMHCERGISNRSGCCRDNSNGGIGSGSRRGRKAESGPTGKQPHCELDPRFTKMSCVDDAPEIGAGKNHRSRGAPVPWPASTA